MSGKTVQLIADVGATNTRCALLDAGGLSHFSQTYRNAAFPNLEALLSGFLAASEQGPPEAAAIAIAAPIRDDAVEMLNLEWHFSIAELQHRLGLKHLRVINDFEALAWGLNDFTAAELCPIGHGTRQANAARGVLGPGSGLGIASLVPGPDGWVAVGGEGGHISLAARSALEADIIARLETRFGHCSAERVLSGPGLVNLYTCLGELQGAPPGNMSPEAVTAAAARGDARAAATLALFFDFLGTVASDLAVINGTRGGVFIAGGIVPQLLPEIERSGFRRRFEDKGRYGDYLAAIPTWVITAAAPAFRGLQRLLRMNPTLRD